jgi:hypothetical protein
MGLGIAADLSRTYFTLVYLNLDATKKPSISRYGFLLQSHFVIRESACDLLVRSYSTAYTLG